MGPAPAAEPIAAWLSADGLPDPLRRRVDHLKRSRCLPVASEVALPVYPHARIGGLVWGRMQPQCEPRAGWRDLGAIVLWSRDAPDGVAAWYEENLPGHERYAAEQGVLFVRAQIADFLWERDYYKYPNVAVSAAGTPWLGAGYRTRIELNRPTP